MIWFAASIVAEGLWAGGTLGRVWAWLGAALATTGLLMGLAGTPHCTAMCSAACAAVARGCGGSQPGQAMLALHGGRIDEAVQFAGARQVETAQAAARLLVTDHAQ